MHYKSISPICLFVYNRPWHTAETLKYLKANTLASQSELYVYSDGPKSEGDIGAVEKVREMVKSTTGFSGVNLITSDTNKGLADSIINGVGEMVKRFGQVIVLEDDLITSPHFLSYMNNALVMYRDNENVASIHGYCYPIKRGLPPTFFIKGADCWGWATWKRAWDKFEPNGKLLLERLISKNTTREFNFNNTYDYVRMLKRQIAGKNDSWAIRWYASAFLSDMYTLYPYPSLVKNIGMDGSGTHSGTFNLLSGEISEHPIELDKLPVKEHEHSRSSFESYFRTLRSPKALFIRVKNKLLSILK